jgi:hypothetical protein
MPNRIARDSARTSKTLAQLTDFGERGFWRLLLAADDFGRFQADPALVLAACFPRMMATVTLSMCEQMLRECVAVGLIDLYEVDGAQYGQFVKADAYFTRRAKHSKYPAAMHVRSIRVASAPEVRGCEVARIEDRGSEDRGGNGHPPEDLSVAQETKAFVADLTRGLARRMTP